MKKPRYNEKLDRNGLIYQDRLSGLSWYQLSLKYGLHVKTLWNIVKRMNQRDNEVMQKSS
jgi:Mor family transcriptional regulator